MSPTQPTRFGIRSRVLDYFIVAGPWLREPAHHLQSPAEDSIQVEADSAMELGSDHACVLLDFSVRVSSSHNSRPAQRFVHSKRAACSKWTVSTDVVGSLLPNFQHFQRMTAAQQWTCLKSIAMQVSHRTPGHKYRDSQLLKDLCEQRRVCKDPDQRLALTKLILMRRQSERDQWLQDLTQAASQGDAQAVRSLQGQSPFSSSAQMDLAFRAYSGERGFAREVKRHLLDKFDAAECSQGLAEPSPVDGSQLLEAQPFSVDEVAERLLHLKKRKCSGPSGVSVEFLVGVAQFEEGIALITEHLNQVLRDGAAVPEQREVWMVLLPKLSRIVEAKNLRPISLSESLHKLYMSLLLRRVQGTWHPPKFQQGGYPGSQVLDALFLAANRLQRESLEQSPAIWVSADVASAFDSVRWDKMRQVLHHISGEQVQPEVQRLVLEMSSHRISFDFAGEAATFRPRRGILQGGTHSSQVFSAIIEYIMHHALRDWQQNHPDRVDAWAYVDDCLLVFKSWAALQEVLPKICQAFQEHGLVWNLAKTNVASTLQVLEEGQSLLPHDHFLRECKWSTSFPYLGCLMAHPALYICL